MQTLFLSLHQHRRHQILRRTPYRPDKELNLGSMDIAPLEGLLPSVLSREIPGTPNSGTLIPILPYHSHKNPLKYGNGMGPASGKGVPRALGVPGEFPNSGRTMLQHVTTDYHEP